MVSAPAGDHWYRFDFDAPRPKLVFFQLELTDRDDLPADVSIFRVKDGKLEEYTEGQDPVAQPHEVQALPGNKFAPRVLRQTGTYYVRVRANHPEFKFRTRVYDAPPYTDPREAVRTAVDYIMGAGDSWFANTPRRGGAFDRVAGVHQETSLCVACHASHFSQRAQLYSIANGYPVVQRQQLQFLEERFYNNPRPFYGFEKQGAVWARVISAPANVLSRMQRADQPVRAERIGRGALRLARSDRRIPEALLRGTRQAAARRDQRQHSAGERARGGLVFLEDHARPAPARHDRAGRRQEHGRSLLPDAGPGRDRSHEVRRADPRQRGAHPLPAAPERPVVDALRSEGTRGRIPDRPRAVGAGGRRYPGGSAAGAEGNRVPAASPAGVRRLDGSAAILREFQDALPRDAVRRAGARIVLSRSPGAQGDGILRRRNRSPTDAGAPA